MPDWQERITHDTERTIRVEHDLRYRCAAPAILAGGPWADLGCGNGVAAADALPERRPEQIVLVDVDADAVQAATIELDTPDAERVVGDLADTATLHAVGELLAAAGGEAVITCFEVFEHLPTFLPLLEWSKEMAARHGSTFILSVPNDAFWSTQNPHHLTCWSAGAFDELLGLLPAERTVFHQIALAGSALTAGDVGATEHTLTASLDPSTAVPSHFLVAFGPRNKMLWRGTMVLQADAAEQRRWERERESQLTECRQAIAAQDETIARQAEELREQSKQFEAWRTYIHDLERELDLPPAGSPEARAQAAAWQPADPPA